MAAFRTVVLLFVALVSVQAFLPQTNLRYSSVHQKTRTAAQPTTRLPSSSALQAIKNMNPVFVKNLPLISFVLSVTGVCFQVFVLYPWHEELSYEFKDLEAAVIRLDKVLESVAPDGEDMQFSRLTDKYTLRQDADRAGPRISKFLPVIPQEERDEMERAVLKNNEIIKNFFKK